jgi:DNA-binding LacI/PurR family transcriptional regulator
MLRSRLTNTIGIIAPELGEGYFTGVMLGVEQYLLQEGFLYFTVSHLGQPDLKDEYQELLLRRVDGFLLVNTQLSLNVPVPSSASPLTAGIRCHQHHARSQRRGPHGDSSPLRPGHRRVAFMKGQRYSLDSEARWRSIVAIAREIGIIVRPELCIFLEENLWSPALGYPAVRDLLSRTRDFTAIFCFNDTSALGAIQDAGLTCPHDISAIGFDDIVVAEYFNPRLTTVRQPL